MKGIRNINDFAGGTLKNQASGGIHRIEAEIPDVRRAREASFYSNISMREEGQQCDFSEEPLTRGTSFHKTQTQLVKNSTPGLQRPYHNREVMNKSAVPGSRASNGSKLQQVAMNGSFYRQQKEKAYSNLRPNVRPASARFLSKLQTK